MPTTFNIVTTRLSGKGFAPWDFGTANAFTAYVGKEFQLVGGNPLASFVTMTVLDTAGQTASKGVSISSDIQFANGTQGTPATINRDQLEQVTFDFSTTTNVNFSVISQITFTFQDINSTVPLYCFIDKLETARL